MESTNEGNTEKKTFPDPVFEYYEKFSQNPELPKYFTGINKEIKKITQINSPRGTAYELLSPRIFEISKPISDNEEILKTSRTITHEVNPGTSINEDDNEIEIKSPSSSIASHKKLEWDSGADIGYSNYQKLSTHKSASFPNLLTIVPNLVDIAIDAFEKIEIKRENPFLENNTVIPTTSKPDSVPTPSTVFSIKSEKSNLSSNSSTQYESSKSDMTSKKSVSSSTSSEPLINPSFTLSSSSTDNILNKKSSNSSEGCEPCNLKNINMDKPLETMSFIKKRIGIPAAQSTPTDVGNSKSKKKFDTFPCKLDPCCKIDDNIICEPEKNTLIQNSLDVVNNKPNVKSNVSNSSPNLQIPGNIIRELNLCITKPIKVECIDKQEKKLCNKDSQTTLVSRHITVGIQTENEEPTRKKSSFD